MRRSLTVVVAALAFAAACSNDQGAATTTTIETTTTTLLTREIAIASVEAGDCLTGLVVGSQERVIATTVSLIGCSQPHEVEAFASFEIEVTLPTTTTTASTAPADEGDDSTTTTTTEPEIPYPGRQRVVETADEGCADRLDRLVADSTRYRLLSIWPTLESWLEDDRTIICLATTVDGSFFVGRTLPVGTP